MPPQCGFSKHRGPSDSEGFAVERWDLALSKTLQPVNGTREPIAEVLRTVIIAICHNGPILIPGKLLSTLHYRAI